MDLDLAVPMLQRQFGGGVPPVEEPLCLNNRFHQAGCTRCVDACPTAAISLPQGLPILAADACVHCGICLHTCPTDVFGTTERAERLLLRTVAQSAPGALGVVCPIHPQPSPTRLPVDQVVRHSRCLAALSPQHLLALSADGQRPLWLDDAPCVGCPLVNTQAVLVQNVATANRLLALRGDPEAVHLPSIDTDGLRTQPDQRGVIDGQQTQYSRRGLFSSLGKLLQEGATAAQGDPAIPSLAPSVGVDAHLPHWLPESRHQLLAWLDKSALLVQDEAVSRGAMSLDGLPFADVQVDPAACSGCGLCARFCPTAALTFSGDTLKRAELPESFVLTFHPALCIDCTLCAGICPDHAVTYGLSLPPEHLCLDFSQVLMAGDLVACAVCGSPTAHRPDDERPVCAVCRSRASSPRPLRGKAGLLADLARKNPPPNSAQLA